MIRCHHWRQICGKAFRSLRLSKSAIKPLLPRYGCARYSLFRRPRSGPYVFVGYLPTLLLKLDVVILLLGSLLPNVLKSARFTDRGPGSTYGGRDDLER
jgi:hypothetical protein